METQFSINAERFKRLSTSGENNIPLRRLQSLFVRMVALLVIKATELGYEFTFGDAWAREGHSKSSLHYVRLAVDLNLFKDGNFLTDSDAHIILGEYWESLGGTWGGRWGDGNHYSLEWRGRK